MSPDRMKVLKLLSPVLVLAITVACLIWMVATPSRQAIRILTDKDDYDDVRGTQPSESGTRLKAVATDPRATMGHRNISEFRIMYTMEDLNVYLYAAFLDDRFQETYVRIFGLQHQGLHLEGYQCRFSSTEGGIDVTWDVHAHWRLVDASWPAWSTWFAMTFECLVPSRFAHRAPTSVVLVSSKRAEVASLPIEVAVAPTKSPHAVAVCIKPMTGQFSTSRMLEWIEIQRLAGIDDFIMYNTDLFGASRFVLEYYQSLGKVTLVSFPYLTAVLERVERVATLTPEERYAVYQQTYLVALHDCLYRHHRAYQYLAIIDVDEIILPAQRQPMLAMIDRARDDFHDAAGYLFLTSWHFEESGKVNDSEIPDFLYMQRYAKGSLPVDNQPKSVIDTNRTISFNFHVVLEVAEPSYKSVIMPWAQYGYLHHYRGKCKDKFSPDLCREFLANSREDPVVPTYKRELVERLKRIRQHLQLI